MKATDAFYDKGTHIPAYDKVYQGRYELLESYENSENGGRWHKTFLGGEYKYFYRIPSWGGVLIDGDQITWKTN
ncbi:hypothetical protein ACIHEI_06425 [Kitasatospora sp. NPDC051984]|uniref:hypothetical protein n=1 Tax=Kitasatospora sp. NPDC051984 TaxID=3364059 RepID=UPI0037CA55CB